MTSPDAILELREVNKVYGREVLQQVLFGINLRIDAGEFVAVVGESGSGKTTLLNIVGLLDRPTTGDLLVHGSDANALDEAGRAHLRRDVLGFVFQFHHLLPGFSVLENALIPCLMKGRGQVDSERDRVAALLERVGMGKHLGKRPNQISGGQAQRVAIVRALANRPSLVLADEPTGNLDTGNSREVFEMMRELNRDTGTSFVMVTHQPELAHHADRTVTISDGRVASDTKLEAVYFTV